MIVTVNVTATSTLAKYSLALRTGHVAVKNSFWLQGEH